MSHSNFKRLRLIDLFSGIGGFSLALKDVCDPVLFCDSNVNCQNVLRERFPPSVPIHDEVYKLETKQSADVICAGFPCQDVSIMNRNGKGIFGHRSSGVLEVLRIAKSTKAPIVILENSPQIQYRGLETIISALNDIGYDNVEWDIFSASDQGAPHERKRFYLIAVRDVKKNCNKLIFMNSFIRNTIVSKKPYWKQYKSPVRVIPKTDESVKDIKTRGFLLGNSIVPQCARFACYMLTCRILSKIYAHYLCAIKSTFSPTDPLEYTINLDIPTKKMIKPGGKKTYTKNKWSTPLAARWSATKIGSERASRILSNQILYEINTQKYMKSCGKSNVDAWVVNPEFIEWMMGYPLGWTSRHLPTPYSSFHL